MTERASKWENLVIDNDGRLIDLGGPLEFIDYGPPPPVVWVPVMDFGNAFGQRVVLMNWKNPVYGLRLASDAFEDAGGWYVHVVGEDQWWAWLDIPEEERPPRPARALCRRAQNVWVETYAPWVSPVK